MPIDIDQAAATSLNKAAANVKTTSTREITKETGIKPQKKVREVIVIHKARRTRLVAVVEAKPRVFNLIEFVQPSKRNTLAFRQRKGVSAKAWGKPKEYAKTFIARGQNSGKLLVFKRTADKPAKPKEVRGPSVPGTFIQDKIERANRKRIDEQWPKTFEHEIQRKLKKY